MITITIRQALQSRFGNIGVELLHLLAGQIPVAKRLSDMFPKEVEFWGSHWKDVPTLDENQINDLLSVITVDALSEKTGHSKQTIITTLNNAFQHISVLISPSGMHVSPYAVISLDKELRQLL